MKIPVTLFDISAIDREGLVILRKSAGSPGIALALSVELASYQNTAGVIIEKRTYLGNMIGKFCDFKYRAAEGDTYELFSYMGSTAAFSGWRNSCDGLAHTQAKAM